MLSLFMVIFEEIHTARKTTTMNSKRIALIIQKHARTDQVLNGEGESQGLGTGPRKVRVQVDVLKYF